MNKIIDEFTNLPISKQIRHQRRKIKRGLCPRGGCKNKSLKTNLLCGKHFLESRIYRRKLKNFKPRYISGLGAPTKRFHNV